MITLDEDKLIPLRDVPKLLPRRPNGKRLHISAVYRWAQRGLGGRQLETIKIGGTTYTSREALMRFGVQDGVAPTSPMSRAVSRSRERQISQAARAVEEILGGRGDRRRKMNP